MKEIIIKRSKPKYEEEILIINKYKNFIDEDIIDIIPYSLYIKFLVYDDFLEGEAKKYVNNFLKEFISLYKRY